MLFRAFGDSALQFELVAFIGDVNRDYAGPWLVKADRLFDAIDTVDSASGKKRGLLVVTLAPPNP